MEKLVYILDNGTKVNTLELAQASGHNYKVEYEPVSNPTPHRSPKAQAMIEQYGRIIFA